MDTTTEKQTSSPKGKSKMQGVLITLIFVLAVFIIACLSLTVFLIINRGPTQPIPMVLEHPSDETVPAGVTQQDLEQAMEMAKNWTASTFKDLLRGTPQGDFSQPSAESMEQLDSIGRMLQSGRITEIDNGTHCLIVNSGWKTCRVQITEGPYNEQMYWVYRKCLMPVSNTEIEPGLFCGFMCASLYIRYLVTAGICCAVIYFLKLKSLLLQILLFVIGWLLLNLLWARLALLLLY